jgi:hypothetical protein
VRITTNANPAQVNQLVTLQVADQPPVTQPVPVAAHWDFDDNSGGADGKTVTHIWGVAKQYHVSVTATFPDGRSSFFSMALDVQDPTPPPQPGALTLHVNGPGQVHIDPPGPITDCSGDCSRTFDAGTVVRLTANPNARATLVGWSGGCGGSAGTCAFTIPAGGNVSVTADFQLTSVLTLTVRTSVPTRNSSVSGPFGKCRSTCQATLRLGDQVQLSADVVNDDPTGIAKVVWGGACRNVPVNSLSCTVAMSGDQSATADIVWNCRKPPQCVGGPGLNANAIHHTQHPPSVPAPEPQLTRQGLRRRPSRGRRAGAVRVKLGAAPAGVPGRRRERPGGPRPGH